MSERIRGFWTMRVHSWSGKWGVVQQPSDVDSLPEPILRCAHREYARQFPGQDFDTIQRRGGFSIAEVISLLADALGVESTDP